MRQFKIWFKIETDSKIAISSELEINHFDLIANNEHQFVIIESFDKSQNLKIVCKEGKLCVGHVEINHSWKRNPKCIGPEWDRFIQNQFDISVLNQIQLEFLEKFKEPVIISSGESDFSKTSDHRINPVKNQKPIEISDWYEIDTGDELEFWMHVPEKIKSSDSIHQHTPFEPQYNHITRIDQEVKQLDGSHLRCYQTQQKIKNISVSELPYSYQIRIQSMLWNKRSLIKDKRVVSVGCDDGFYSTIMAQLGAKCVLATDVRDKHKRTNNSFRLSGFDNICNMIQSDINDLTELAKILKNQDTLLMSGILYHVNNHYQLFETIAKSDVKNIIIDCDTNQTLLNDTKPVMHWISEDVSNPLNGFEQNKSLVYTGKPNAVWVCEILKFFGFAVSSVDIIKNYVLYKQRVGITDSHINQRFICAGYRE